MNPQTFKDYLITRTTKFLYALKESERQKKSIQAKINDEYFVVNYDSENTHYGILDHAHLISLSKDAKVISFSSQQANVFLGLIGKYKEPLDFRLPFEKVFLMFDEPLEMDYSLRSEHDIDRGKLMCVALHQFEATEKEWNERASGKLDSMHWVPSFDVDGGKALINSAAFVYSDFGIDRWSWQSYDNSHSLSGNDLTRTVAMNTWRSVVIACIGYINCVNVNLEMTGFVKESVNAKRESKGKSRLNPYYVCKIVNKNSESIGTGTGSHHQIRYDVRGHFRRYDDGKTIWVRPHQRGLENEIYVPKIYRLEKGAKDESKD